MSKKIKIPKEFRSLLSPTFIIFAAAIIALYFFTRIIDLTKIPVFADEAIYIRWAQIMKNEPSLRFLPQSDGKQPLFMWLIIPAFKIFTDPLFTGRFVSVLSGFGTLVGIASLTWYITRSRFPTLLASFLYVIIPYTLFFDRMALVDSLLSMFAIWSIFIGILYVHYPRLDLAMILGFVLGGGLITKSPGVLFLLLQPVLLLTVTKKQPRHFLRIILGWAVTGAIAVAIYSILKLGPNSHMIGARNQDYIFGFKEVLSHPLNPLTGNLKRTFSWFITLFTWPIFITILASIFSKKYSHYTLTLFFWALLPLLFQASIAKVYTPRYLLYAAPPLLIAASLFITQISLHLKKNRAAVFIAALTFIAITSSYKIITDPVGANLPERMRSGYFQEWTAGHGLEQAADYLINRSKETNVLVGTEGYFGTLPDGLQIYTQGIDNITVIGVGQPIQRTPESLKNALVDNEVYLVVNKSRNWLPPIDMTHLETIAEYEKSPALDGSVDYLQFFRLHEIVVR